MFKDKTERLADIFGLMLPLIDQNHGREGLRETPMRAAKAFIEYTKGQYVDTRALLKSFDDGVDPYTEVIVKDIPFYSMCEHHLAPFFGTGTIAYKPGARIVGLSKLARLLDAHSRRLQVQERITHDVAADIMAVLKPEWVTVRLEALHMCMCARGVRAHGASTVTEITLEAPKEIKPLSARR